jgi:hypothetical protein
MPSTVYKGDLAEVAFGQEAGMLLEVAKINGATIDTLAGTLGDDSSKFIFGGSVSASQFGPIDGTTENLRYPVGMLIGSRLILIRGGSSTLDELDEYAVSGRIFTIIENTGTSLQVTPKMKTAAGVTLASGDALYILPFKTPAIDVATAYDTAATDSDV